MLCGRQVVNKGYVTSGVWCVGKRTPRQCLKNVDCHKGNLFAPAKDSSFTSDSVTTTESA